LILSQQNRTKLAHKTNFTRQHISRVLRGICEGSVNCIEVLSKEMNLTVDELRKLIKEQKVM